MKRRQLREIAFQTIYQVDVGKNDLETSLVQRIDENDMNESDQAFYRNLVVGTMEKLAEIDGLIEKYALEWKVDGC